MKRLGQTLRTHLISIDPRSLGLFRITFATVLLLALYLRFRALPLWYTNEGLLPNHTMLWARPSAHMFSLFFTASTEGEARLGMTLCALAFAALLVGWKTRWMQALSYVCLVSLNSRILPLENGGDFVLSLLATWSLFLPLGKRFSVDALLASMRAHGETDAAALAERTAFAPNNARVMSLAVLALLLQFFCIYFFNAVHKTGPTWTDGSAVHYVLHQDRIARPLAVLMREHAPEALLRGLTWGTLVVELVGAFCILCPFFTTQTRALAVIMMPALHVAFEACLDLGPFSFAMSAFFPLLLTTRHWEWLAAFFAKRHRARIAYFDGNCGVCLWIVRVLARMDRFEKITFIDNQEADKLPAGVDPALTEHTLIVLEPDTGKVLTNARAALALLACLPFCAWLAASLSLPGLRHALDFAYKRFADNRARVSMFYGLAACGVPSALSPLSSSATAPPSDARLRRERVGRWLGEACVALLLVAGTGSLVNSNGAIPRWMRYAQPAWLQTLLEYPRIYQGWSMFAPHAPLEDFTIEVDAETFDGRHVDPYNEIASRVNGPGYTEIPANLHQDQYFTAYSLFVWRPHFRAYHTALQEWILHYPDRTHRPSDRIRRFRVYKLSDKSPPPGKTQPTDFKREEFLRYPAGVLADEKRPTRK